MANITIVGAGYVGTSLSVLLAQKFRVVTFDIDKKKVDQINNQLSPIDDKDINVFLKEKELNIQATSDKKMAYSNANFVVVATPTDYDERTNRFNTKSVESVIEDVMKINNEAVIIIKSTVPIGFTKKLQEKFQKKDIIFSPEFLREGKALYDNLYPSRIIMGSSIDSAKRFATFLADSSNTDATEVQTLFIDSDEAEAIKLFSNTYLAMRVAYFNEVDTFCELKGLKSKEIIDGIGLDPRIGSKYCNPSFGYGGYCLPKDTKQLLSNYNNVPSNIIKAVVDSNETRKKHVADSILAKNPSIVGAYRLSMKEGSDNFRESSIISIIEILKRREIPIIIFEPLLKSNTYLGCNIIKDIDEFKAKCDLIISNRLTIELDDVSDKVYSRDIYKIN